MVTKLIYKDINNEKGSGIQRELIAEFTIQPVYEKKLSNKKVEVNVCKGVTYYVKNCSDIRLKYQVKAAKKDGKNYELTGPIHFIEAGKHVGPIMITGAAENCHSRLMINDKSDYGYSLNRE